MLSKEHVVFLSLKAMEAEIIKLDSISISILRYLKEIKNYNENFKQGNSIDNNDNKFIQLMTLKESLKNFKYVPLNIKDKFDIKESINSITLRSEYSDDLNEFIKENQPKNKIKTNKTKLIDINIERSRTFTPKLDKKKDKLNLQKSIIDSSIIGDNKLYKFEDNNMTKSMTIKVFFSINRMKKKVYQER